MISCQRKVEVHRNNIIWIFSAHCNRLATLACAIWFSVANAAEIMVSSSLVTLEGKIEPGDFDKLRDMLLITRNYGLLRIPPCPEYVDGCPATIHLASPGGDVEEAMKIGRLVRTLGWNAIIPTKEIRYEFPFYRSIVEDPKANRVCTSACFFIFVGAINRMTSGFSDSPILGVHRPYLTAESLSTLSGSQAITAAHQTRAIVENYLKEMGVPAKYTDQMFSTPKDVIRWIDDESFEADFAGIIPELRDWVDARCDDRTDQEKAVAKSIEHKRNSEMTAAERLIADNLQNKHKQRLDCEKKVKFELRKNAWQQWRRDTLQNITEMCNTRKSHLRRELETALSAAKPNHKSAAVALGLAQKVALCGEYQVRENAIRLLANRGDARAQRILGNLYLFGSYTIVQDKAEGIKWIGRAGSQGDGFAQRFYRSLSDKTSSENNKWTTEDYGKVVKWGDRNCPALC